MPDKALQNGHYSMGDLSVFSELNSDLMVIDDKKLAKISERMKEVDRANHALCKKNTQATSQLMTLTMMCDAPYRRLRQVLAQIEQKRMSIEDAAFKLRRQKIQVSRLRENDDELAQLKADQLEHSFHRSKNYLESSLKELATYQDVYDEIKAAHNIPDDWDELNLEQEEIANHIRMAFRNGVRNMMVTGMMNMGTLEYFEQFGIHPVTAKTMISDYLERCDKALQDGSMPTVDHLYEFLDTCAETFKDCHKSVMRRIGIDDLIKDEYLFTEMRDAV